MIENILVPTDGSDFGRTAIAYGISMARRLGARLTGLHVIDIRLLQAPVFSDVSGSIGLPPYQELLPAVETGLEERAEAILREFRERCAEGGVSCEAAKAVGVIDDTIIEAGRQADWILLAQRGEHFHLAKGSILGSTAEAVVRKSGKPVMVTPQHFREIESMALAWDGSPPATHALRLAIELSNKTAWPLTILTVVDEPSQGAVLLQQAETHLEKHPGDVETITLTGAADKEILRFLQEGAVELLVMGAYGKTRLRQLFVGCTTSQVIRKSPVPVLLTR